MTPIKRTETITKIYWDCGRSDHRHKTEDAAADCMLQTVTIEQREGRRKYEARKAIKAFKLIICGATYKHAANEFGLSVSKCTSLVKWLMRIMLHPKYLKGSYPSGATYEIHNVRLHKDFWLLQANELENKWWPPENQ